MIGEIKKSSIFWKLLFLGRYSKFLYSFCPNNQSFSFVLLLYLANKTKEEDNCSETMAFDTSSYAINRQTMIVIVN